jgi:hypothetical protein
MENGPLGLPGRVPKQLYVLRRTPGKSVESRLNSLRAAVLVREGSSRTRTDISRNTLSVPTRTRRKACGGQYLM